MNDSYNASTTESSDTVIWNDVQTSSIGLNFSNDRNLFFFNESIWMENPQNKKYFSDYPDALLNFGAVCSIILAIFGISGNFISILALSNCKHIRNATTAFIVNLCASDLLFCCFCIPLVVQVFLTRKWFSSDVICKIFAFVRFSSPMVSMFTVLAITINRYILIVHPNIYPLLYKRKYIFTQIGIIWLFPIAVLSLPLSGVWGRLGRHPITGICTILTVNEKSPKMFIYIIGLLVPSLLFLMCYTAIYIMVRKIEGKTKRWNLQSSLKWIRFKRNKSSEVINENKPEVLIANRHDKNRHRLVRMMLVIFVVFTFCYFPMFLLKVFRSGRDIPLLNVFSYICFFFSTVINPVIYIVMSREYRKAYKSLFCKY